MITTVRTTLELYPFDSVSAIFTRATNGEKVACCVFDSFVYVAGSAITYVTAHKLIDQEVAIRVPLILSKGGPMIESFVKLLLIEKDPDGEPMTWQQRGPIVDAIEQFYAADAYNEGMMALRNRIEGRNTDSGGAAFKKLVADFFVKNSSVNQTLAKFVLKQVPLLEKKLFVANLKKFGLKDLILPKKCRLCDDPMGASRLMHDSQIIVCF